MMTDFLSGAIRGVTIEGDLDTLTTILGTLMITTWRKSAEVAAAAI